MRKRGASEWDVQTQLGHRRPGPTETYTAFDPDYPKGAAALLTISRERFFAAAGKGSQKPSEETARIYNAEAGGRCRD